MAPYPVVYLAAVHSQHSSGPAIATFGQNRSSIGTNSPLRGTTPSYERGVTVALTSDECKAVVRGWIWTYWGRPLSVDEQKTYSEMIPAKGLDATLAAITDHANHAAFQKRRGW